MSTGKRDIEAAVSVLRHEIDELVGSTLRGQRDPAFYRRVHKDLSNAYRSVRSANEKANQKGPF